MFPRWSEEYEKGVDRYIEKILSTEAQGDEICCPCKLCFSRNWYHKGIVKDHIIVKGFAQSPVEEDETEALHMERETCGDGVDINFDDDMNGLLCDAFRDSPDEEAARFYKLVEDGQQELYPGCKNFTKLSFTIWLFLYKRDHNLSNIAFDELLKILKAMQPDAQLPGSFNEAKKVLKALGLDYTKIDACPNDCMLYWEQHANRTSCHVCNTSRWKSEVKDEMTGKVRRIPAKVLRYFPIKKRLQRLFMCPETASHMTWHSTKRPKDGLLRHPADGDDWKNIDFLYPEFAEDPRNVRLGLSSDGFNPFNTMSIAHSTWPVILTNYNMAPWLCMKSEFLMLALLIPGPSSPGNNIDVYLQPLEKDLCELWEFGIETYDASRKQMFNLRTTLLFTISDFPGYAMLSGWSTKGKWACPCCHYETCAQWLTHSKKMCYMGHRRFLEEDHPFRRCKRQFNGEHEYGSEPVRLSGTETFSLLKDFKNEFGKPKPKSKSEKDDPCPWKKKSIFFDLPYWKHITCRHYLDVMHIEKNICDSILGTLLDIPGKTKDHLNARKDLKVLNMMPELQPKKTKYGKRLEIPKARFWMTSDEKRMFCEVIKNAKLPQGYGSNIARCVQVREKKISGYKSHDAHFLMHYLLPVAAKKTLHKDVAAPLIRLCAFFKGICSKAVNPQDLDYLQSEIKLILCHFEMIFPCAFFDIMVHLPIHLAEEIKYGGPVSGRWMFPIERYLRKLKSYVHNKSRPEGSMAEAYLAEECTMFCARYLHRGSKKSVDENISRPDDLLPIFSSMGRPVLGKGRTKKNGQSFQMGLTKWTQAHQYVLFNCNDEEVEEYIRDHKTTISNRKKRKWDTVVSHRKDFIEWFREKVDVQLHDGQYVPDYIKCLSAGPSFIAQRYSGYCINGYRFHTMKRDARRVTQNSGVTLTALTTSFASARDNNPITGDVAYYGSIQEIIEIYYQDHLRVVLFGCNWYANEKDEYGFTHVTSSGWQYVIPNLPRDKFDEKEEEIDESPDLYLRDPYDCRQDRFDGNDGDDQITRIRVDVPATLVDIMGKRERLSQQPANISEYEKERLKRLASNDAIMKARGLNSLTSKALQKKYLLIADSVGAATNLCEEDTGCDLEDEFIISNEKVIDKEVAETGLIARKTTNMVNKKYSSGKEGKSSLLSQNLTMSDFLKLEAQKRKTKEHPQTCPQKQLQQSNARNKSQSVGSGQKHQEHQIQSHEKIVSSRLRQDAPVLEVSQKLLPKKQTQQQPSQRKSKQAEYCAPGSMASYMKMRKMQAKECHNHNVQLVDVELDDLHLADVELDDMELDDAESDDDVELDDDVQLDDEEDESPLVHEKEMAAQSSNLRRSLDEHEGEIALLEDIANNQTVLPDEHETAHGNQSLTSVSGKKKHRGRTIIAKLHARSMEERDVIILNDDGQPIGPTVEIVSNFSRFLGTVAKNPILAPLNYMNWKQVPTKEKIWDYVKRRFIVPDQGQKYVLETVNALWRVYKARLKKKHFYPFATLKERLDSRPEHIPVNQFTELMVFWGSQLAKEISDRNKMAREMQEDMHTMGPRSYAVTRHQLQQIHPNHQLPSYAELYKESRKRAPGRIYKTKNDKIVENIEKMSALQSLPDRDDKSDPYYEVITKKEHSGRLRLYGRSVTKTTLKAKHGKAPFQLPSVYMDSIVENLKQKIALQVKLELQEEFLSQIRAANPGIDIVIPNFVATPGEASSGFDHLVGGSKGLSNSVEQDMVHQDEEDANE